MWRDHKSWQDLFRVSFCRKSVAISTFLKNQWEAPLQNKIISTRRLVERGKYDKIKNYQESVKITL